MNVFTPQTKNDIDYLCAAMASENRSTITLITGASRGIGRALVKEIVQRPNNIVIAAMRNMTSPVVDELQQLSTGTESQLIVVKIDSEVDDDASKAIQKLTSSHGLTKLDTVIANAGLGDYYGPASTTPAAQLRRHFNVNAVAPLVLFQAAEPLLKKSSTPKFFIMSSNLASISLIEHIPFPGTAYGTSKCAANFITRKLHFENEWLTTVVLGPGWVQTDMGAYAAKAIGAEGAPVTLEQSIEGLLKTVSGDTIIYLAQWGVAC